MAGPLPRKKGIGHWYGEKKVVLSPEAQKKQREIYAKFQADVAAERERVAALKFHPELRCAACGTPHAKTAADGSVSIAEKCPRGCPRSHGIVFAPQPLPAQAKAMAEAKAAADAASVKSAQAALSAAQAKADADAEGEIAEASIAP